MPCIDVHHHLASPRSVEIVRANIGNAVADGMNVDRALEDMERGGIDTAINSIPVLPRGVFTDAEAAVRYARENNEYLARLVADYPGRFGMFAALPLPHVDATLAEIEYALDVLKADGVHMMTSYLDHWPGDKIFAPVFDELNRRKAIVYSHPHSPACCIGPLKEIAMADATIEYGTDTTRAIANFVFSGSSVRNSELKMIWSHAGGTMPFLIYRFLTTAAMPENARKLPNGLMNELKRFYYDTAQASHKVLLTALRQVTGLEHVCFGSDYPWGDSGVCVRELNDAGVLSAAAIRAIKSENVLPLLPRFRALGM